MLYLCGRNNKKREAPAAQSLIMKDKILCNLCLLAFGALARLPLSWLYVLSDGLCWVMLHVWHYRRGVVRDNLLRVFPDRTDAERRKIEVSFYHHLCDLIVETIKLLHISDEELARRVEPHGIELADECARQGVPCFVLCGHSGNWEWAEQMYMYCTYPMTFCQVYHPLRNKVFDQLMLRIRKRFGSVSIPQLRVLRTVLHLRGEGKPFLVAFIADQHPNTKVQEYWTTFLGQDSSYITGAEEIGRKIGARFIFMDFEQPRRGYYRISLRKIEPAEGEPFPYTISYLRMLEASILRQPELWLWSHRRWRLSREEYNRRQALTSNPRFAKGPIN